MPTTKPTTRQYMELVISLTTSIVRSGGNAEIVETIISADNPLEELFNICGTNNIRFIYTGEEKK